MRRGTEVARSAHVLPPTHCVCAPSPLVGEGGEGGGHIRMRKRLPPSLSLPQPQVGLARLAH